MKEERQEVRVYRVNLKCDSCKEGNMIATGTSFTTGRTYFEHRCSLCGHLDSILNAKYPTIEYEPVNND